MRFAGEGARATLVVLVSILPLLHHGFHLNLAKKVACGFRQCWVAEHSGAEFEAGDAGQARDDAEVPVKVEVGIFPPVIKLSQDGAQDGAEPGHRGGSCELASGGWPKP